MPNFLTIQKPDRHFSVIGFVSMLKPNVFEGTHYKRCQRCILWLTAMHCYFVAEPRSLGPHTPEEEHAFQHAYTTFKAAILSMLGDSIVDAYVPLQTVKTCRMHLRPNMEFLMLVVSCMSWSSFMTIGWLITIL